MVFGPIITFVVLALLAFFIPNFHDISYQPLLGYAAFLAIMSLIISFLLWFFTRKWRRERKKNKLEKEIRKYEDDDDFKSRDIVFVNKIFKDSAHLVIRKC